MPTHPTLWMVVCQRHVGEPLHQQTDLVLQAAQPGQHRLGPRGQAGPSASLFRWDGGEGAAAGCAAGIVSAISEISAPRSRTWHRHAFCLLICENARGRLACWVGVGVSVWYFADMQLYSVFRAGRTSASSEPGASLLGWILHRANHSYTAPGSLLAWIHPDSETE